MKIQIWLRDLILAVKSAWKKAQPPYSYGGVEAQYPG